MSSVESVEGSRRRLHIEAEPPDVSMAWDREGPVLLACPACLEQGREELACGEQRRIRRRVEWVKSLVAEGPEK